MTLSWIGPFGGGANNGQPVAQSRVLTNTGNVNITAATAGLYFPTGAIVSGGPYTVKQCVFFADDQTIVTVQDGTTGVTFEDCLVFGPGASGVSNGGGRGFAIGSSTGTGSLTINRCHLPKCGQHPIEIVVGPTSGHALTVTDTYIHDLESNQPGVDHFDCIYSGGGVGGTTVLTHNSFFNDVQTQTSALFFESFFGTIHDVTITNNQISGINYNIYCRNPGQGFGNATNFVMTNNHIGAVGQLGYMSRDGTGFTFSGNVDISTGANIDGLL